MVERPGLRLFVGVLTVAVISVFLIFLHNRYLPIHEGWFSYYGSLMRQGKLPYRDFYFFAQPVTLFISELFTSDHLISLRRFGLIERITLAGMLYYLLSRKFSPMASFWATIVSLLFFGTYISDAFFSFLADSLVALVGAMIFVYQAYTHPKYQRVYLLLAGVCASLSFFCKQTTGFFASVAIALLIVWFGNRANRIVQGLVFYSAGWWIAAAPIIGWLVANRAWQPYLNEAYKGAAVSKGGGSIWAALFGFAGRSVSGFALEVFALVILLVVLAMRLKLLSLRRPGDRSPSGGTAEIVWTSVIALGALLLPVLFTLDFSHVWLMRSAVKVTSRMLFYVLMIALARACLRRLRVQTAPGDRVVAIFLVGGGLWALSSAMSYMVEQQSVILGLALFTAAAYDSLRLPGPASYTRRGLAAACLMLAASSAWVKYSDSFDWHGWRSRVSLSPVRSRWAQLADYEVDRATRDVYDTILDDVVRYSKPGQPIFTFMSMPMFNWIPGRPQPTFCPVHYFDVCPDDISEADAQRVKMAKPPVMIVMSMPEELWRDQEEGFRRGNRSGQRAIQKVIDDLTVAGGDYTRLHSFPGSSETTINVWVRIGETQAVAKKSDHIP